MSSYDRREFLADVGKGMLVASIGPALAADLGLSSAAAAEGPETLSFGPMEPLVEMLQQTPADKLLPLLVEKLHAGTELRTLVGAAGLANARTFGGEDYTGYHAFMALAPAFEMVREMPEAQRPLPVLKVIHRNSRRMQEKGGRKSEVLHPIPPAELPKEGVGGELLRAATRKRDMETAERTFAALAKGTPAQAYDALLYAVEDETDVHRVVLAWRAWAMLPLAGKEQAHTLLRQSVRYCVREERPNSGKALRAALPKLLDEHRLLSRPLGTRQPDDAWVEKLSLVIYGESRERAAAAAAAALAEGMSPEAVGEAISLAANRLVLCDPGRTKDEGGKPKGSVHGASVGVHASDSANAWRNIARVSTARHTVASLIVGAFHTAGQAGGQHKQPFPHPEHLEKIVAVTDADGLLREAEAAIKDKDQARACALIHRYGTLGQPTRPAFDLLLRYAVSEDGALHAEKYYRTVSEEFAASRAAFRGRHLAALARVTASEYGEPAPGYAEARRLLKL